MMTSRLFRLAIPALIAATVAGACSSSKSSSTTTTAAPAGSATTAAASTAAPTTAAAKVSGTLNGSGSTFQAAYDQAAIQAFQQANSGATINYQGKGSGAGQTDLQNKVVDFAGSDATVPAANVANFSGQLLYFPTVVAPITVSYNVSGVTSLQLSATTVAKIFAGKITNWNDPAFTADGNSGLPNLPITVVHRSDSSGTTQNFTDYLNKADPTDWTLGSSKTINWPGNTVAGNGNTGVASAIKAKNGAVGYVDFSDAKAGGLVWAKVKNSAGNVVDATLAGASAAAGGATVSAALTYDPANSGDPQAYPITSETYIITYAKYSDAGKVALLQAFLKYILGSDGQNLATTVDFAPLPSALDQKALAQVDTITAG